MDIKIDSNTFIEINKLLSINTIKSTVNKYILEKNILEGEVLIEGEYTSSEMKQDTFSKIVPFTVVFKDENIKIEEIEIEDLNYQEVINQGIELRFEINVEYENQNIEESLEVEEVMSTEASEDDYILNISDDSEEEIVKENIENMYEELLDDIFIDDRDSLEVNDLLKDNNRVVFTKFKNVYSGYRVYYPKNERELERICALENKSLDEVYKFNSDFIEKRRIIIK